MEQQFCVGSRVTTSRRIWKEVKCMTNGDKRVQEAAEIRKVNMFIQSKIYSLAP